MGRTNQKENRTEDMDINEMMSEQEEETEVEVAAEAKHENKTEEEGNQVQDENFWSNDANERPAPTKGKKGNRRSGGNTKVLEIELEKQKERLEEAEDRYKRLLAEFENARNRNQKESSRMYKIGAKEVLENLLPIVDNFERALQTIPEEDKDRAFEQGVDKIYKQLMVSLGEMGVHAIEAVGSPFNPDLHNAVLHIEDEEFEENVIVEEMQKGYMYKDTVLRYSMVKVAN